MRSMVETEAALRSPCWMYNRPIWNVTCAQMDSRMLVCGWYGVQRFSDIKVNMTVWTMENFWATMGFFQLSGTLAITMQHKHKKPTSVSHKNRAKSIHLWGKRGENLFAERNTVRGVESSMTYSDMWGIKLSVRHTRAPLLTKDNASESKICWEVKANFTGFGLS